MNKTIWRPLLDAVLYLFIFIIAQIASALLCSAVLPSSHDGVVTTVFGTILCSIVIVALFTWQRWSPPVADYLRQRPWGVFFWVATAAIGAMIISDAVIDAFQFTMPDDFVRIMAPVAEEIAFRGGILRSLLRVFKGKNHWWAILFSALLFGLVHGNMAQGANALLLGLLLGWLYYRTDSVVPDIILHWVNNTIAYVLYKLMPGSATMSLNDLCGGNTILELFYIACALCMLLPSLRQLHLRLTKRE